MFECRIEAYSSIRRGRSQFGSEQEVTDQNLPASDSQTLTAEDIEAAYERALSAMEAVEDAVDHLAASNGVEVDDRSKDPHDAASNDGSCRADSSVAATSSEVGIPSATLLHPREIIEAALFVGGQSLTNKRLGQMLGDNQDPEQIDTYIDELNRRYQQEDRPYQIDFGEGGYRLILLPEFEPVRDAVYGAGPKEVKLSQDALEVLAFIAYRQPTTKDELIDAGKETAGGLLRQLLRRELIAIERSDEGEVFYGTTSRFLELFGLRSLDDLPFPEDLELK